MIAPLQQEIARLMIVISASPASPISGARR
jgi:hypothetical protein